MLHASPTSKSRFALRDTFAGYAFLFPFLAIYAVLNLYPMIQGFDSQTFDHLCQSIALYEKEVDTMEKIKQNRKKLINSILSQTIKE